MLKFKSIAPLVLSNLRNARLQLYSKAASQAEPALSMPDALGAKVEEAPVKPASNPVPVVETSVEQTEKTIAAVETSQKADVTTSSAAAVKKPKGCKQAGGAKGKKGKKCGQPKPPPPPRPPGPPGGNYLEDKCGWYDIPRHNTQKWRKISYALIPFALGLSAIVLATRGEPPEQDYIPYEYMYMRTKRFPWGDGKKSLFHGPYNIIPEEEEERIDREAEEAPPSDKKEGGAGGKEPRYKRSVDEHEEKLKLRDQHAKEELERRKKRHEQEKAKREAKEAEKAKKDAAKAKKNQDA
ncbi:hypothetical protein DOY81_001249, partial [Sarcophaga bullata]